MIASLHGVAEALADYFPEGSGTGDTKASPAIWEDPEGFATEIANFKATTTAAFEASGRAGPADLAAFQAAIGPVLGECRACHEKFQTR